MPVGTVVIPKASVAVNRNVDFDFAKPEECSEPPYRISKPVRWLFTVDFDDHLMKELRFTVILCYVLRSVVHSLAYQYC